MVVNEVNKGNRSVRPKLLTSDSNDSKNAVKVEKKHRLKQRFEVIKKLGQGTYGKVQLAINKETGQEVAIKTIKKSKVESDQDLIRIRREIQIMSSIQHPHIVHIFEVFENKEKIVLVMQYASGGEVYDYVSYKKVLTDSEARRLFRQIATAIYYCHKNKICHRDLKLENILLDEKGNAKIADFGLSNVFDERHFLQTFCGSPLYASPEIVKGSPYYGPEVDCWSLGVLLYTLVYGAMPFDGSNFKRLVKQISESNYFEPKQKSDASALIKRLLTPNPTKRATIIDICTDWWVNRGYEHSLLQVAEDMANLTPVRLDILLALAPVSPTAEQIGKNPFTNTENINKDSIDKSQQIVDNLEESADDKSFSSVLDNNVKKRQASTSFDQSLSQIPPQTQTPHKKKTKKSQNESLTSKAVKDKPIDSIEESDKNRNEMNSTEIDSQKDQNLKLPNEKTEESPITQNNVESNLIEPSDQNAEQMETINTQSDNCSKVSTQTEVVAKPTTQSTEKCPIPEITNVVNESNELHSDLPSNENEVKVKETVESINNECEVNALSERISDNQMIVNEQKESTNEKQNEKISSSQKTTENKEESQEVRNEEKKKTKMVRTGSFKRPGKLSIPNLWDKTPETIESPTIKSSENKIMSQLNQSKKGIDTKADKKVPFIPVGFKVSDAKRAFERRCSVPANSLLQTTSSFNKRRESKPNTELKESNELKVRPKAPKLSTRSLSCAEMLESPKRVQEMNRALNNQIQNIEEKAETLVNQSENQMKTSSPQTLSETENNQNISVTTPTTSVVDKNMAKDILKKSIAKAKLMEKRQNSNDSGSASPITTPLVSIENSDLSITQEPSLFRKPRPFVKDDIERPTIEMPIEIKVNPNLSQRENENESVSKQSDPKLKSPFEKTAVPETVQNLIQEDNGEKLDSPLPQQTKSTPIARSYKKVTFTKDGATITETGKIYSSEGADGSYTRVEKKSKVTHFPTIEDGIQSQPNESNASIDSKVHLQRSDSHSSSGSTDIFDDIFDDHWCGDSIFPNMKSLLHSVIGHRKDKKTRRRSRAESCERNNSDWFTSGYNSRINNSTLTDHESDTDDFDSSISKSVWPISRPHGSIFDKSLFSKHFSNEFDKDFGVFEDSNHPFHEFNRSLSRDRSNFSSRIHPTSFKVVFGGQPNVRTGSHVRDNYESDDAYGRASKSSSNKFESTPKSFGENSKSWFRDRDSILSDKDPNSHKHNSFDSSRKRVEQWLQSDNNDESEDFDKKGPLSMYATVGPRGVRRYLRTISGRPNDKQNSEYSNSTVNSGIYRNNSDLRQSGSQKISPLYTSVASTVPNDSVVEMRFTLNPTNTDNNKTGMNSTTNLSDLNSISISNCQTSVTSEPSECSDDYQSSIAVPESSSLLDQLRTHGYRNIVTQRLSGSSLFSDLETNLTENDTNYKRGKSVLNSSASVLKENANACECMDTTNPMATTAVATHIYADNEYKASESMTNATQVEFADSLLQSNTEFVNMSLKHTVNQQSCEPTSRMTHSERSSTSVHLPESNHPLKANKAINNNNNNNINLKETVQERIHRKSFYSRFNDDRSTITARQRRRSFIDSDDLDLAFGSKLSSFSSRKSSNLSSRSFRNSLSLDNQDFVASKPPPSSSDWFHRMESRASQLMDDLMVNDRSSIFHEDLRNRELPDEDLSLLRRRRSSSTTRSTFSTPRSNESDFDSFFNSYSNSLSNNNENKDNNSKSKANTFNLLDEITSPAEVLRKAIDILSQKD